MARSSVDIAKEDSVVSVMSTDPASPNYVKVPLTNVEFTFVFIGMVLGTFLFSLDQTIVSTAIPSIVGEFQALDQIAWIGTSFLITSTSFSPLYGRFADIFGRKPTFLAAIIIFEIGSVICAAANSMNMLIVGRAVAGIGGGGMYSLILIIIADIVSLRDRGKFQGLLGAAFGLSSVAGPLMGGVFTDSLTWRWCFWINLPIGAITLLVALFLLKFPAPEGSMVSKLKRIDALGTLIVVAATTCLLIPLQYGGTTWAWSDWRTISMLVASAAIYAIFALVEIYVADEPVIPPSMFENRSVYALIAYTVFLGASFFGLVYFLPTYFQLVNGDSATTAGLETIPLIGGAVVFSITSGILVSKFGYYTPFIFFGSVVLTIGVSLISTFTQHSTRAQQVGYLLIAGIGIGNMLQMRVIGLQSSVSAHNIAAATSASTFFMSLGGAIGIAVVGSVFNNVLQDKLGPNLTQLVQRKPSLVRTVAPSPEMLEFILDGFSTALDTSYKTIIPFAAAIFIAALFIKQAKPGSHRTKKASDNEVMVLEI